MAVLDADKEGFLRSETSLIQTMGRAARNAEGKVILYADTVTPSMRAAMDETARRRSIQDAYNQAHGIVPKTIVKSVRDLIEISKPTEEVRGKSGVKMTKAEKEREIARLERPCARRPDDGIRIRRRPPRPDHRAAEIKPRRARSVERGRGANRGRFRAAIKAAPTPCFRPGP